MKHLYLATYAEACDAANKLEAEGYETAVLISGEVRYWGAPAVLHLRRS